MKDPTEQTIRNCFHHAGIIQEEVSTEIECSVATTEDEQDDFPLSEWLQRIVRANFVQAIWMDFLVLMMTFLQLKL